MLPPIVSIVVAFLVSAFFVLWSKNMPIYQYFSALQKLISIIVSESFSNPIKFMEVMVYSTPLLFCAIAHTLCFHGGMFNIGVEGQFMMGMVAAGILGQLKGIPAPIHITLILLGGILCGGLWAALPGFLKATRGINEVVVCIMTNFVAMHILNYVALRSSIAERDATATFTIQPSAFIARFVPTSRFNVSSIVVVVLAVAVYLLLFRTKQGYQIRAVGLNESAARAGGIYTSKILVFALTLSGVIAGIGGVFHVAGVQQRLNSVTAFPGYGMDAIAIALLSNKNPIACIFVAILFGALRNSSRMFQIEGIPKDIVYVIQAIIIFFVAADFVARINRRTRREES